MLISIHGSDLRKVAWIDNDKPHTLNYFDDVWTRYLETGSSIFEFTVYKKAVKSDLGDNRAYNLLNDKAFVSFKYKGRSYVFSVMQIDEDETTMHCVCENLNLELINEYSNPYKASKAMTFSEYCKAMELLNFSLLQIGRNEVEEKKLALGTPEQKDEAFAALRQNEWATNWYLDERMDGLYRDRMFYSDVVAGYEQLVRKLDLVLGYRLHGNLMALANGTPSIYFTYDSRTVEFADTFRIPSVDVFGNKPFALEEYWDQTRFDRFNAAYARTYSAMSAFLSENKVDHKMTRPATAPAAPSAPPAPEPERKVA